jgi:hypothetical protein
MEKIWYEDIQNFITPANYMDFFPTTDMTFEQQLNSIVRFSVYFSVVVVLLKRSLGVLYFVLFVAGFTFFMNTMYKREAFSRQDLLDKFNIGYDNRRNRACQKPTNANPFMNVLTSEYKENPKRESACDVLDCGIKKQMRDKFDRNLFRDSDDVYHRKASDRQFYTTPITTIPNDQEAFAKWCYESGPTCKENGLSCWKNEILPWQTQKF